MNKKDIIYVGALLHDIGKVIFRAQRLQAGVSHEDLGESFIREYVGKIRAFQPFVEDIIRAANRQDGKVWLADCISAQEREEDESKETRRPLLSIFTRIDLQGSSHKCTPLDQQHVYYIRPEPLEREVSMPVEEKVPVKEWAADESEMIDFHSRLLEQFKKDLQQINGIEDTRAAIESLYTLLEKYTSNVVSAAYRSYPDISLYDHSRIVAALSICLEEATDEKECLVIEGDLSGIQKFIYSNIHDAKDPGKQLRGRSAYIVLLSESIADHILRRLQLYSANLLFNAGGHFLIVAPNNDKVRKELESLQKDINRVLFRELGISLSLSLAWEACKAESLITDYREVINSLSGATINQKYQKYFSILTELFTKDDVGSETPSVEQYRSLGEKLPKADFLLRIHTRGKTKIDNAALLALPDFSMAWAYANKEDLQNVLASLDSAEVASVQIINIVSSDVLPMARSISGFSFPISLGIRFFGNYVPKEFGNKPMTFDDLAKIESEEYPLLGIARMDVDSLGALFQLGLKEQNEREKRDSLSRFATLSRSLSHFFSGHINYLASKHQIYLVYSGGDDLFAVGSWIKILDFVEDVRKDFERYVAKNPCVTISCGVSVGKQSYPISLAAEEAGQYLEMSKSKPGKDSITVFGRTVRWEEFYELRKFGERMFSVLTDSDSGTGTLPSSLVHNLLTSVRDCFSKDGSLKVGKLSRVTARIRYAFARRSVIAKDLESFSQAPSDSRDKQVKVALAEYLLNAQDEEKKNRWWNFQIPASYVILKHRNKAK